MKKNLFRVLVSVLIIILGFDAGIFIKLYVDQNLISALSYSGEFETIQIFLYTLIFIPVFSIIPSILCINRAEKSIILWGILGLFFSYFAVLSIYIIHLSKRVVVRFDKKSRKPEPEPTRWKKVNRVNYKDSLIMLLAIILGVFLLFGILRSIEESAKKSREREPQKQNTRR